MENVNQSDIQAFNAAVRSVQGYNSAARGGAATIELAIAGREAAGLSDAEIFQAIARGAGKRSGLCWLARVNGTLVEYLGAWGALAFIGISTVGALVAIKQNASRVLNAIIGFVKTTQCPAWAWVWD